MTAKLSDIYNLLLAGKTVAVSLGTETEVENFRTSIYRFKRQQDKEMLGLEMMDAKQRLTFSVQKEMFEDDKHLWTVTLKFTDAVFKTYNIRIVEEKETSEAEDA